MAVNKPTGELIRLPIVHEVGDSRKHVISQWGAKQALNGKVDKTQKVNGKALDKDITLDANDIGAPSKAEMDATLVGKVNVSDVLSTLGQSTTQTVSQKLATDEISKTNTSIDNQFKETNKKFATVESRVTSLENNKADKATTYTKEQTNTTFLKKIDISNARYIGYVKMTYDETKKAFIVGKESLLGRCVWVNPEGANVTTHVSVVLPPIPNSVILANYLDGTEIKTLRLQLNPTGDGLISASNKDLLYISKL